MERWVSCELLSNLYLRHIENNGLQELETQNLVVNCFRTCIFVILKTTIMKRQLELDSCELLSNLYLRHIENNWVYGRKMSELLWIAFELVSSSYWKQPRTRNARTRHVVNCFRTCIFVILKTTSLNAYLGIRGLWIAFELVSSSYWKQQMEIEYLEVALWIAFELVSSSYWKQHGAIFARRHESCELLSNLYLRHIENNGDYSAKNTIRVVNCFRTCIFVILKTTKRNCSAACASCELLSNLYLRHIENNRRNASRSTRVLWIAFELVSSSYWKQLCPVKSGNFSCCELLSNLYLRHIENNTLGGERLGTGLWIAFELVSSSYWKQPGVTAAAGLAVVNCFRTCIFVILKTTGKQQIWCKKWLWIAFELVSSSYWKQLR